MSDGLAKFEIDVQPTGTGSIVINGEPIEPSALSFHCAPGKPPLLQLQMAGASGTLSGEGIVQVELKASAEKDAVKKFLKSVSPGELDERVCERMEWDSASPMKLVLDVLWDLANVSD